MSSICSIQVEAVWHHMFIIFFEMTLICPVIHHSVIVIFKMFTKTLRELHFWHRLRLFEIGPERELRCAYAERMQMYNQSQVMKLVLLQRATASLCQRFKRCPPYSHHCNDTYVSIVIKYIRYIFKHT